MKIFFDKYNQPVQPKVYLGTPNNKIICALDGLDENSFDLNLQGNNTCEISFDVYRHITIEGFDEKTKEVESKSYRLIGLLLRIYVENIGWFIMNPPTTHNDGKNEYLSITAESCEIEMQQHDINNLKINKGTTDSYEMLVEGNVDIIGDVEFAKEQIKFYNKEKPELSFLDIVMKVSGLYGWTVGYIDNIPKTYKYYEDGKQKEKQVLLADEIGTFDIEVQDLYSFLTQDAAKFFSCVFVFDFLNFEINAYRPENLGKDTNINIGFKNIQNTNDISIDENNIFTRYFVSGSDDLNITYVNFGSNYIENIKYYLNEKYLNKELISKYELWLDDVEIARDVYIENTKLYNKQQAVISELKNRLPLDDCSTDWSTFSDDRLLEAQANYQAQLKGYEQFYVDENGDFDEDALKNSQDADTYYQIRDVILPSIQIEIDNRNLPDDVDPEDYIDSYKTNWKLYGLDELGTKIQVYKNDIKLATDRGCNVPYDENSKYTQDYHDTLYKKYKEAELQLDAENIDSCMFAYNQRKIEVENATSIQDSYDKLRKEAGKTYDKETWVHKSADDSEVKFTPQDLSDLSKLYIDGSYTNQNMFLTNSDDSVTAIDEQLKLLSAAQEDLEIASQPQCTFTTRLDNFLALSDYKDYIDNLNILDFLYLGVRDDYVVKLRCMSVSYNPLIMDNDLQITFSNMLQSASSRNDFSYLLDSSSGGSKKSSSGSSSANDFLTNEGVTLTAGLIQKLLASGAFKDSVSNIINNEFGGISGQSMSLEELNAKLIKVTDLFAENGFFEYLQAKLISADKIVAGSGTFDKLKSLVADIDNLLAGNISGELGHIIELTAENVRIDSAVIRDLIAAQITVSMLKAGDISADSFHIVSDDGGLEIAGNTMQFKDANGVVRIQIGRDANNEFTFCLYDETGKGVLIDSTGIKESAIKDGLIVNDMIKPGTIGKDRLNFNIVETDENGKVDWGNITANGQGLDVEFGTIKEEVKKIEQEIEDISKQSLVAQLDKEMALINCDKNGLALQNELIEIHFSVYKGLEKVPATAQVGVLPSGMTLGQNTSSTATADGTIILNVAKGANLGNVNSGSINIKFIYEDREISKAFSWGKLNGSQGEQGEAARTFILESDVTTVVKDDTGKFTPSKVVFSSYYRDGKNTNRSPYNGRFIIQESTNGVLFENKYLSASDESSHTYTITNPDVKIIKCSLYASGGVTQLLDIKSVSILSDISTETIEEINKQISGVSQKIDAVEKSITNKVWQTDIDNKIDNFNNTTIKTVRDQVAEMKIEVGKITSTVSDVKTTLEKKADGTEVQKLEETLSKAIQDSEGFKQTVESTYISKYDKIGARNLIRNSRTLIFEDYKFVNDDNIYLVDENNDYLVDENDNFLVLESE